MTSFQQKIFRVNQNQIDLISACLLPKAFKRVFTLEVLILAL